MAKRGLGRGLEALLPAQKASGGEVEGIQMLLVEKIKPGRHQPRREFDLEKLEELARSIKSHGVIQPIIVKPVGSGSYEVIAGERRLRACQMAGITEIPAIIKELDARETAEIALIENLQREDLNPMEEAAAYQTLISEHGLTQEEIAARVGKSRPVIANALRLLNLPQTVQEMVRSGIISPGHARIILSLKDEEQQIALAEKIAATGMAVREAEALAKKMQEQPEIQKLKKEDTKAQWEVKQLEDRLQSILSTKVKLKHAKEKGKIEIYYFGNEELERIINVLTGENVSRETF
ncbi:Stage 0 sporulation protein J [Moorella humiferrea]|uniref:ParB/RepB/Spo0J family partition protein n=1 Tax=Neomoorella humiferrea TaxID=676965 RepID=UPI0030CF9C9B